MRRFTLLALVSIFALVAAGCSTATPTATPAPAAGPLEVVATTTFLADIAAQVAGDRARATSLTPFGTDPHAFQPTPGDLRKITDAHILIVHGQGLEEYLGSALAAVAPRIGVVEAAAGLVPREREDHDEDAHEEEQGHEQEDEHEDGHEHEADMHYWLDPNHALTYVENIRLGFTAADPEGASVYAANAEAYSAQLKELDQWIRQQVEQIPVERRLLVTDHHTLGYFADRYGFHVVGAVVPSVSPGSMPSAQQMVALVAQIQQSGTPAIFLEQGSNPRLVEQIAAEAGVKVGAELYGHGPSAPDGPAPTYIDMMKYNVEAIVQALR